MMEIVDQVSLQEPLTDTDTMRQAWDIVCIYAMKYDKLKSCQILISTTIGMAYFIKDIFTKKPIEKGVA